MVLFAELDFGQWLVASLRDETRFRNLVHAADFQLAVSADRTLLYQTRLFDQERVRLIFNKYNLQKVLKYGRNPTQCSLVDVDDVC